MPNSGAIPMASYPGHSSPGQARSGLPQYLGRPSIPAKSTVIDRVGSVSRDCNTDLQDVAIPTVDMFVTVHNTQLPQFMSLIPEPRCSIATLAGMVDVYVSSILLAKQGHSETLSHSGREIILKASHGHLNHGSHT